MRGNKVFKSTFGGGGAPGTATKTRRPAKRKSTPPRTPATSAGRAPVVNGSSNGDKPSRLDLIREKHATHPHVNGNGSIDLAKRGRMEVSIDKLIEDPKNERKVYRDMEGLIASVRENGVLEPITVTPVGAIKQSLMIMFGHRRYRAARAAGLKTVEVLIRDPEDEKTRRVKSIVSNVQRQNVGPIEMAESLAELLASGNGVSGKYASQRDIARAIGRDETWVSGLLGILKLSSTLRHKLETSQVSVPYDAAIQIARVTEPALQNALVETAINGATVRQIRKQISASKPSVDPRASGHDKPAPVEPASVPLFSEKDAEIDRSTFEIIDQKQPLYSLKVARRGNGRWVNKVSAETSTSGIGSPWQGSFPDRLKAILHGMEELTSFASGHAQNRTDEKQMAQIRGAMDRLTSRLRKEEEQKRAAEDRQITTERDRDETAQSSRSVGPQAPASTVENEPSTAAPAHTVELDKHLAPGRWNHHLENVIEPGVTITVSAPRRFPAKSLQIVLVEASKHAETFRSVGCVR